MTYCYLLVIHPFNHNNIDDTRYKMILKKAFSVLALLATVSHSAAENPDDKNNYFFDNLLYCDGYGNHVQISYEARLNQSVRDHNVFTQIKGITYSTLKNLYNTQVVHGAPYFYTDDVLDLRDHLDEKRDLLNQAVVAAIGLEGIDANVALGPHNTAVFFQDGQCMGQPTASP